MKTLMKQAIKGSFLVILSVLIQVLILGPMMMGFFARPLGKMESLGPDFMLFLLLIITPSISSIIGIGILGGLWIKGKKSVGFILGSVFVLIHFAIISTGFNEISFDLRTIMGVSGFPVVVLLTGITYQRIMACRRGKLAQENQG